MTGDIGTGKTLLCRTVLRASRSQHVRLGDQQPDARPRRSADADAPGLRRQLPRQDQAPQTTSRHDLVHALEDFLSSLIALEAHAVVMIDEAQHVQPDVLEQIRLLSNIDAPGGTMLQIILVGQLDLEAMLARPELRQFQQRVSRRIRLEPLSEAELQPYIDHRLAIGRAAGSRMPGADELARALGGLGKRGGGRDVHAGRHSGDLAVVGRPAARRQSALRPRARSGVRAAPACRRRGSDWDRGERARFAPRRCDRDVRPTCSTHARTCADRRRADVAAGGA